MLRLIGQRRSFQQCSVLILLSPNPFTRSESGYPPANTTTTKIIKKKHIVIHTLLNLKALIYITPNWADNTYSMVSKTDEEQVNRLENQVDNGGGGAWEYLSLVRKLKLRRSDKVLKHGLPILNDSARRSALGPDGTPNFISFWFFVSDWFYWFVKLTILI